LTLVEVAVVLSVIGTLLAVALPTLSRTIQPSKLAEAREQLDAMYRAAADYYAAPRALPGNAHAAAHCLPPAAGPTPSAPSQDPVVVDFAQAPGGAGAVWAALGVAPSAPLRFRYSFLPSTAGCSFEHGGNPALLILRAEGDLDGDGTYSQYERRAQILPGGELHAEPVLHIQDRVE
jgi:type II secretory pathway pseudopilin PulG